MKLNQLEAQQDPDTYAQLVRDHLSRTLTHRTHKIELGQAHHRYSACDITASSALPSFANSQMDGYAITATACTRPQRTFTVGQDIPAGSKPQLEISDDIAYPIMTGAPLPTGYSAVIPEEQAKPLGPTQGSYAATGSRVELPQSAPGQFVRQPGEDIQPGEILVKAGTRLNPAHLGTLASQGLSQLEVKAGLRVLVLTGGDEVAPASQPLKAGKIYDANGPLLTAQLEEIGAEVSRLHLTDTAEDLITALKTQLAQQTYDLIISSGGISHGKYEVIKKAISLLAAQEEELTASEHWFGHVQQQPGGPQGLILLQDRGRKIPWVAFPGNPVSTLISYHLLLYPALLHHYSGQVPQALTGIYQGPTMTAPTKTQFRRGQAHFDPATGSYTLTADPATGSHLLHRAAGANALIRLEPSNSYRTGSTLHWYPINH